MRRCALWRTLKLAAKVVAGLITVLICMVIYLSPLGVQISRAPTAWRAPQSVPTVRRNVLPSLYYASAAAFIVGLGSSSA